VTAEGAFWADAASAFKELPMPRKEKLIVVRHGGDELLFYAPAELTKAQRRVVRSVTRKFAIQEFGEAKVKEAEQDGMALIVGASVPVAVAARPQ
jgi:hypothetical protein